MTERSANIVIVFYRLITLTSAINICIVLLRLPLALTHLPFLTFLPQVPLNEISTSRRRPRLLQTDRRIFWATFPVALSVFFQDAGQGGDRSRVEWWIKMWNKYAKGTDASRGQLSVVVTVCPLGITMAARTATATTTSRLHLMNLIKSKEKC